MEWAAINRHLQTVGTATCDVSSLIMDADDLMAQGQNRAAFKIMAAARDVLKHRKLLRQRRAGSVIKKPKRGTYRPKGF